jgi:hypothetical protein
MNTKRTDYLYLLNETDQDLEKLQDQPFLFTD